MLKRPKISRLSKILGLFIGIFVTTLGSLFFYTGARKYVISIVMGSVLILLSLFCKMDDK